VSYSENGFKIINSSRILEKINEINALFCDLLDIQYSKDNFAEDAHVSLSKLFKDQETYFGFLKAFTNLPAVQEICAVPDLLKAVKDCGVDTPTLVTPPILHVVAKDLIVNEAKVFTPPHQDVVSTKGSVGQVVVWIPLHDVKQDNFGISAITKSHKMGTLDINPSDFGHTVKSELIEGMKFDYLELTKGESVIFSQYLVHHTHTVGTFRMALSFRFNDMKDSEWKKRKYFVPFERKAISATFEDGRDKAPNNPNNFLNRLDMS
jgi:ectoine hydroxylase-related dioxygenase (phytanoyl-CoA dioxygenase family)